MTQMNGNQKFYFTKKGGDIMKRMLGMILALCIVIGTTSVAKATVFPSTTDYAFVVCMCTVTASVIVDAGYTTVFSSFNAANLTAPMSLAPGQTTVLNSTVTVKNNSSGAITHWRLYVSSIDVSADGMTAYNITDIAGVNQISLANTWTNTLWVPNEWAIGAVFKASTPTVAASNDFDDADTILYGIAGMKVYQVGTAVANQFAPDNAGANSNYNDVLGGAAGSSNSTSPGQTRCLWFKVEAPTSRSYAENYTRFTVTVECGMNGCGW